MNQKEVNRGQLDIWYGLSISTVYKSSLFISWWLVQYLQPRSQDFYKLNWIKLLELVIKDQGITLHRSERILDSVIIPLFVTFNI